MQSPCRATGPWGDHGARARSPYTNLTTAATYPAKMDARSAYSVYRLDMRILLVEDNAELARLLTESLAGGGFAADVLGTAADARVAIANIRYSAVVLDLGLPDDD